MDGRLRSVLTPRLVIGLGVIALGIIFLLDNMNIVESDRILAAWPVVFILIGLIKLFDVHSLREFGNVLIWVGGGALLLLINFSVIPWRLDDTWPLILVVVGIMIVAGTLGKRSALLGRASQSASADSVRSFALMAGVDKKVTSQNWLGGEASAVMGGVELHLHDARPAPEGAELEIFAMWGGVEILVPEDWTVTVDVFPLMGGVEDTRKVRGTDPTKRLRVKGFVVMGGAEIKN